MKGTIGGSAWLRRRNGWATVPTMPPERRLRNWPDVTEHRIWHLERLRRGDSASLGTKVGTCWARWLAAGSICAWGLAWAPLAIRRLGARTDAVGLQSVGPGLWRPRGRAIEADAELDAQMPNPVLSHTRSMEGTKGAGQ